ncbi:penicillin-binding protein 1A [Aquirhabdus parva]|uniref:Penicillin-binding protein 1A n=1 Tax=Aquirhabdus parva TaxID=2283318 RepID=A0A345P3S3_9GAMM|nr:PBP1A family penicillin-binding protein [Aquirhabdus parva]AXI01932.1 PBP1A family penicillin-binding protein [Aquirhabdus parva]
MKKLSCAGRIHPLFALLLVLLLALPIGFYGLYLFIAPSLPDIAQLKSAPVAIPLQVYSKDNKLIGEFGEKISRPVTYDEIPPLMVNAFLAAEDSSFFTHNGVSFKGLGRAVTEAMQSGSGQSGGSTITMQVAKNFYLSPERTLKRKLTEIFLARKIEQNLNKQEIFTLYVNKIFLGQHAYGIAAAAKVYYHKPLKDLTIAEMAMIAGLPKAPTKYNPVNDPDRAIERRNWIIGRMLQLGFINQAQYQENINAPLALNYSANTKRLDVDMPYVAEMVRSAMVEEFGEDVLNSGYRVYTTIPSDRQKMAEDAVHKGLEAYDHRHGWRGAESNAKPLADHYVINNMWPVQVTKVSKQSFDAVFSNGLTITVPWSGMSWARKYYSTDRVGGAPSNASEIVHVNDIIRVRPSDLTADQIQQYLNAQNKSSAKTNDPADAADLDDPAPDATKAKTEEPSQPKLDLSKAAWSRINWTLTQIPAAEAQLVSLDPNDGAIQAVVGGYDFAKSNFNRSMQGWRQPGSNIKPFIYSLALERGFTPYSIINDAPLQVGNWRPQNSDGKFMGPITLRRALYLSRNLVSVRLLQAVGINKAVEHLTHFGFMEDKLPKNLALALGAAQALPIQVATGYAAFANGGYRIQPYFIERVESFKGDVLFKADPVRVCRSCDAANNPDQQDLSDASSVQPDASSAAPTVLTSNPDGSINSTDNPASSPATTPLPANYRRAERVLTAKTAYDMASILRDVIQHGTGYAAMKLGRNDIGGKTGTTNDAKDAWFSGFNPTLVAVAWVGFDQPRTLGRKEFGGVAALPIWSEYMAKALANTPESWIDKDPGNPNSSNASGAIKPRKKKVIDTESDSTTDSTSTTSDSIADLVESKTAESTAPKHTPQPSSTKVSPSTPLESPF